MAYLFDESVPGSLRLIAVQRHGEHLPVSPPAATSVLPIRRSDATTAAPGGQPSSEQGASKFVLVAANHKARGLEWAFIDHLPTTAKILLRNVAVMFVTYSDKLKGVKTRQYTFAQTYQSFPIYFEKCIGNFS